MTTNIQNVVDYKRIKIYKAKQSQHLFFNFRYQNDIESDNSGTHIKSEIEEDEIELQIYNESPLAVDQSHLLDSAVKRRHKTKNGYEWSHEEIVKLIELWSNEECLYNIKIDEYHDKDKRILALKRIKDALEVEGIIVSTRYIASKMHSLRVYFSATRNKMRHKHGSDTEEVPKVKWPYFEKLMFLNDNVRRKPVFNNNRTDSNDDEVSIETPSPTSSNTTENVLIPSHSKRKSLNDKEFEVCDNNELRQSSKKYIKAEKEYEKTTDDLFCEILSKQLKSMDDGAKKEVLKLEIQYLFVKAQYKDDLAAVPQYNITSLNTVPSKLNL